MVSLTGCWENHHFKPLNVRPPCLGTLSMRRLLVAPLSGAAQCHIVIAIYRIRLTFAGNELGNAPTVWKQLRWRRLHAPSPSACRSIHENETWRASLAACIMCIVDKTVAIPTPEWNGFHLVWCVIVLRFPLRSSACWFHLPFYMWLSWLVFLQVGLSVDENYYLLLVLHWLT